MRNNYLEEWIIKEVNSERQVMINIAFEDIIDMKARNWEIVPQVRSLGEKTIKIKFTFLAVSTIK